MSTLNVGAMAARLGLDPSEFLDKMKGVEGFASASGQRIANEMKRTNREGAESLRLIDEALGIHVSRPIARIVTQEFPQFAAKLQSLLGVGVALGIGFAAFDFIAKGFERIGKAVDDAKKKEEEFVASTRALQLAINQDAISTANSLDQITQKLAQLSGDKAGALAAQLRIISREDAQQAVAAIDAISEAYQKNAKAAIEAESASAKFWRFVGSQTTGAFDKANEKITKQAEGIRAQFNDIVTSDPLKGMEKGADYLRTQLEQAQKIQAEMHRNELSAVDEFLAGITFTDDVVVHRGAVTKDEVKNYDALVASLKTQLQLIEARQKIDAGHKTVARAESAASPDPGDKEIEKLKADTAAQLALAAAVGQSVAAQKLQQASGEADQLISRILEEAHGRLTAAIKAELAAVHALTAERMVAKDAIQINQELQKETEGYAREITSLTELAAAYKQGGSAIADALIDKQLEADRQKVAQLTEEYDRLKAAADEYAASKAKLGSAAGPSQGLQGVDPASLDQLKTAIDKANASLVEHRKQLEAIRGKTYDEEINKTSDALRGEQPLLDRLNQAYTENAEAIRHAQVALSLYHWEQAHPGATDVQIKAVSVELEHQSINAQRAADAQLAGQNRVGRGYDDEIAKLERAKEVLQSYGESTLLIDAQIKDAQQQYLRQWDDAAFKVGSFGEKYRAVMNEVALQGQQAGEEIAKAWLNAIDQIETGLAKLATGQKVDFGKILQNLAEQQTKAEIQKGAGAIAAHFGIKLPGLQGKPDGTAGNPLHVAIVSGLALAQHAAAGAAAGVGKADIWGKNSLGIPESMPKNWGITDDFKRGTATYGSLPGVGPQTLSKAAADLDKSGLDTDKSAQALSKAASDLSSAAKAIQSAGSSGGVGGASGIPGAGGGSDTGDFGDSSDFSSSAFDFGGFMATGGDVHSGKTYMVGEHGPELFRASTAGEIVPNHELPQLMKNANSPWTFDPHSPQAAAYENYEKWLHRGDGGGGGTWSSLIALAGTTLLQKFNPFKKLENVFHHPTADSTATAAGGAGYLPGGGFGAGIGAGSFDFGHSTAELAKMGPDFGGFMADGGDVFPGLNYFVGERGPELLRIPASGQVTSNSDSRNMSRGGDVHHGPTVHQTFNGIKDSELFRRTTRQENARMFRNLK